jgi:hypothetical protein
MTTTMGPSMMRSFDPKRETPIPLSNPLELGSDRTRGTLVRWATSGVRSRRTHKVIFLEAIYIGGALYSSREAYYRFIDRLNGGA